jgi:hypothetical protein
MGLMEFHGIRRFFVRAPMAASDHPHFNIQIRHTKSGTSELYLRK